MWDGIICCFLFRCCWLLLGAVRYFFFFYLIRCFWVYVALLFFLMSASLLIPRHSCTNLSLQLHIVKCRKIREQEKTQTHTQEHARTHRHTIIIHKHGGTTTTSSIATHRVFVHSVDSVFYFIIFFSTNGCCACVCQFDRELKIPAYFNFFFCSVICFVNKIISCVDRKSIAIP